MRRVWIGLVAVAMAASMPSLSRGEETPADKAAPDKYQLAIKSAKKVDGLWTIYHKDQQVLVEMKPAQLGQDYMMLSSISRGISKGMLLSGMSWGDDVIWSFRKVGDKVHLLRKNVRFKAKAGTPEASAVKLAYSDSVMYALPVVAESGGNVLIDMTRVFMSDDEQIGKNFGGMFVFDRSTINKVKGFPKNVEIDVNAVYATQAEIDTVPDSRGVQVGIHYSISAIPSTGYKPRLADDRVGYFLSVTKDFSENMDDRHFVRYVTRWDLQKADPTARLSPPKEPIIFYMEKTVPVNLRPIVRAGIEDWNKAFEKIGFANAIEVRQQREDDEWDPEDVRYNTFRWITSEAGMAIGPSRVNPLTGQILDADILFDASFLRSWSRDFNLYGSTAMSDDPSGTAIWDKMVGQNDRLCMLSHGMQQQVGFASAAFAAAGALEANGKLPEEYLHQALKEVVMHEVGHTLGLRHNFKASGWKPMAEIEDPAKADEPTVASVMDYSPVCIAAPGGKQGAYYTKTIGPYDVWAIEYGYKPIAGDEAAELAKIASRSSEPGLDYGTDEDTRSTDPDPLSNRFDMGSDPLVFARRQMTIVQAILPKLLDKTVADGEGFQKVRLAFSELVGEFWRSARFAARVPGGVSISRDHKGQPNVRAPFRVVPATQQRDAMKLLAEFVFASPQFDPTLMGYLASNHWSHWGVSEPMRQDPAMHDLVEGQQRQIVSQLLNPMTLSRIQDNELRVKAEEDAYTLVEHLDLIVQPIFADVREPKAGEFTARKPYMDGYRRNLQRLVAKNLASLVTSGGAAPEDARVLARQHLVDLSGTIDKALKKEDLKLDPISRAHLTDLQTRIDLVLKAELKVDSIN